MPCGKEAPDVPLRSHQHLTGEGKWTLWALVENSEAWGTSPSHGVDVPEGKQLLGGVRCQPALLLNLLAAEAGREENLVFIVRLFLISFCFRDPLLRENDALRGSGFLGWAPAQLWGRWRPGASQALAGR